MLNGRHGIYSPWICRVSPCRTRVRLWLDCSFLIHADRGTMAPTIMAAMPRRIAASKEAAGWKRESRRCYAAQLSGRSGWIEILVVLQVPRGQRSKERRRHGKRLLMQFDRRGTAPWSCQLCTRGTKANLWRDSPRCGYLSLR